MSITRIKKWLPGIFITLLLTAAAVLQFGRGAEQLIYRAGLWLAPQHPPSSEVVVVGLDAAATRKHGPRPWPRDLLAGLTTQLTADKARVIAFLPASDAAQNTAALEYLNKLAALRTIRRDSDASVQVAAAQAALSTDQAFADSIQNAGTVILAAYGVPGNDPAMPMLPPWLTFKMSVARPAETGMAAMFFRPESVSMRAPLPLFGQAAAGVGYMPGNPSSGAQPLIVNDGGQLLPSFGLLVAAYTLGLKHSDIVPHATGGISLGDAYLFTDAQLRVQTPRNPSGIGRDAIPVYGFDAVLNGEVPAETLAGKTVIVGSTVAGDTAPALVVAGMISGILTGDLVATPFWAWWLRGLLMLLIGAYLMLAVTRLRAWLGIAASVAVLIVLVNGEFIPLLSRGLWLPLTLPILFLIVGHALVLAVRYLRDWHGVPHAEFSETNRQLALACQTLGRYSDALRYYRRCLPSAALYENLLHLGQDHERHRRYPEAIEVYTEMKRLVPEFGNVEDRLHKLQALDNHTTITRRRGGGIVLPENGLQKPVLGRYELLRELGRGAMSVVYLGRDQRINRTVAIKTLSFADEFEGTVREEVTRRFFREAETAGRLNHPNIVTIYDVGEDQGLAYIAMDFLQGEPLQQYALPTKLLPIDEVVAIVTKIAEALDYAHGRQVVHRDIKPANIMYERSTGRLKITDFGVASVLNASKTRTGTLLGSPSYMSPEQVAGGKADGRSDLYSIGITLYQLLRGELPFEAPSLTGLMFKIANTPPPDVTFLRPDISPLLKDIVERCLQKKPQARFQTGAELADALRQYRGRARRAG